MKKGKITKKKVILPFYYKVYTRQKALSYAIILVFLNLSRAVRKQEKASICGV